jgi:hypothetical protein
MRHDLHVAEGWFNALILVTPFWILIWMVIVR